MTNNEAIGILAIVVETAKGRCFVTDEAISEAYAMAIKALEAQERQCAAQKRRYTFGNDEFSLEDAYHDCKLVFDGITDDDSFQEADTGAVLYYANEIIYALHEALDKDTNVLSNDCISRQAAIEALNRCTDVYHTNLPPLVDKEEVRRALASLPSAQPEPQWIPCSERLPEVGHSVLLSRRSMDTREGCLQADGKWWQYRWNEILNANQVNAWMPLPRAVQSGKENR